MLSNNIKTEEYYVSSIDLLGVKDIILTDTADIHLNSIRNIYKSWTKIVGDSYFQNMKIKIFSDNLVIAIEASQPKAADKLFETIGWICSHFLRCGYKPRGGVCKGRLYIDDIFVWGSGLVDAYLLESKQAKYPRIILSEEVVNDAGKHLSDFQIDTDVDGIAYLNYLKAFGGNKHSWIEEITEILEGLYQEIEITKIKISDGNTSDDYKKIYKKIEWLIRFAENTLSFWKNY